MDKPFFSIIIPTKDRPHFLRFSIESLLKQSEKDFECIVVNNSLEEDETKAIFDSVKNDKRFRYVRPDYLLPMHENWEFGLSFATGQYISILIDKIMLLPNCLQLTRRTIYQDADCEVINWWSDAYNFNNEDNGMDGIYRPSWEFRFPKKISSEEEIKRKLNFVQSRNAEGHLYFRGKICFGVYHENIINKVKEKQGSFFLPFSPDYTSLAAALSVSDKIYDVGMPGCISITSNLSNGKKGEANTNSTIEFVKCTDPEMKVLKELPVKGLLDSVHNFVARDYMIVFSKYFNVQKLINMNFLRLRVLEDCEKKNMKVALFTGPQMQYHRFMNNILLFCNRYFLIKLFRKILLMLARYIPMLEKYIDEIKHRNFCLNRHVCASPLEALDKAHEHYMSFDSLPYNAGDKK